MTLSFTIEGAPRTKKTSNRLVTAGRRRVILPSKQFEQWNRSAQLQLARVRSECRTEFPIGEPVHVKAFFFRDANRGDLNNYQQALADALQEARIIHNDKQIVSWDGSRLYLNPRRPCIEVAITTVI